MTSPSKRLGATLGVPDAVASERRFGAAVTPACARWFARSVVLVVLGAAPLPGCAAKSTGAPPQSPPPASEAAPVAAPAPASDSATEMQSAGAAAERAASPSSTKAGAEAGAPPEMELWGRQLDGAVTLATPDCLTAWALRDRICDLAQRLCDMAGRSAEPEIAERCTDGRARCDHATTRVRAACPE